MMLGVPPLAVCAVGSFVASGGAAIAQTWSWRRFRSTAIP